MVWKVLILSLISNPSSLFSKPLRAIPSTPTTNRIIVNLIFHRFCLVLWQSWQNLCLPPSNLVFKMVTGRTSSTNQLWKPFYFLYLVTCLNINILFGIFLLLFLFLICFSDRLFFLFFLLSLIILYYMLLSRSPYMM